VREGALLAATLFLAAAALGVLSVGSPRTADSERFQRLVRGLGLGPAPDLARCACAFDPRVEGACSLRHEPVPFGSRFCPSHAAEE
jgi:hypothetical protein